jgi:hypothetical protein
MPAGEHAGPRWIAERELAIGPLEADSCRGQAVDAGRLDELVAIAAQFRPQVIDGDKEDVELDVGSGSVGARCQRDEHK